MYVLCVCMLYKFLLTKTPPPVIAPAASSTHRNSFSVLLRWDLFWSRSTHSLSLGMNLCVHLPFFDESHSSCHILKRVSFDFPRMIFLCSSGKCPGLRWYSSCSTHISFLSRASNLIGVNPESTFAAALHNVRHLLILRKFILRCTASINMQEYSLNMQECNLPK